MENRINLLNEIDFVWEVKRGSCAEQLEREINFFSARRRTMTNTTPRAGYPAPTSTGRSFPPLQPYQRKHMRISTIDGVRNLTWYYKIVIFPQKGAKMTIGEAIYTIGTELYSSYDEEINIVNITNNRMATEDELVDIPSQSPSPYYSSNRTNHTTNTSTITIQLRTQYTDNYYDLRDPLGDMQCRFPNTISFHLDEYLGVATKFVGALLHIPHKHIHRDTLARAISASLPQQATESNPIIKAAPTELTYTSNGKRHTITVVGIFAPIKIKAEVCGTIRKILCDDDMKDECGLGNAHFYSSKELARGPTRDSAIKLHLELIESQTTVNLFRLDLHDLRANVSHDLCAQLLLSTHKKSQFINTKLDLLQAYFQTEHKASTARLSYFRDKRGQEVLHIHTNTKQQHLIFEALHALDSSPLRGHFFLNSIYHALPPEAREYLTTADSPQERLTIKHATHKLLQKLQSPRQQEAPSSPPPQQPSNPVASTSYAAKVKQSGYNPSTETSSTRIRELEHTIATLSKQVEAQSNIINNLNNTITMLQATVAKCVPTEHDDSKYDDDDVPDADEEFYRRLEVAFTKHAQFIVGALLPEKPHSADFPPIGNDMRAQEWATLLAAGILNFLHEPHQELSKQAREQLSEKFSRIPSHLTPATNSLDPSTPPPPLPSKKKISSPEVVDLSHDAVTPTNNAPTPEPAPLPPLPSSPSSTPTSTALVPLRKTKDIYMEAPTTTNKRPAESSPKLFPTSINPSRTRSKKMDDFYTKLPKAKLTKSAKENADLAN